METGEDRGDHDDTRSSVGLGAVIIASGLAGTIMWLFMGGLLGRGHHGGMDWPTSVYVAYGVFWLGYALLLGLGIVLGWRGRGCGAWWCAAAIVLWAAAAFVALLGITVQCCD